jgi:hypothetical protein
VVGSSAAVRASRNDPLIAPTTARLNPWYSVRETTLTGR